MKTRTKVIGGVIGAIVFFCVFVYLLVNSKVGRQTDLLQLPNTPSSGNIIQPAQQPEDRLSSIDQILEKLEFGNIAFNAPKTINLRDTAIIQLMLDLKTPVDQLKQMIEAAGEKQGAQIRISDRMEARLSGSNFAITAITPEIQAISRNNITEWKWKVKPSSDGRHYLHLTLSALLSINGASTPRAIRTFDQMIEVEVAWHQRVIPFFEKNWQWLWAAILVPIAGWLWKRRSSSESKINQPNKLSRRFNRRRAKVTRSNPSSQQRFVKYEGDE